MTASPTPASMSPATLITSGRWNARPLAPNIVLGGCGFGTFDEFAALEFRSGADEGDQVWSVDRAPADLGGFDEFECHRDPGSSRAGAFGDAGPQPDGRESRLDRICGAQVHPMLGRVVVESEQHVEVVADFRDRFGPFRIVVVGECFGGFDCLSFVFG